MLALSAHQLLALATTLGFGEGTRHRSRDGKRKTRWHLETNYPFQYAQNSFSVTGFTPNRNGSKLPSNRLRQASIAIASADHFAAMTTSATSPHRLVTSSGVCDWFYNEMSSKQPHSAASLGQGCGDDLTSLHFSQCNPTSIIRVDLDDDDELPANHQAVDCSRARQQVNMSQRRTSATSLNRIFNA